MFEIHPEYRREARSRFWGWTLFGWLVVVALFIVGLVKCAEAAEVFRSTDDKGGPAVLRLSEEPCSHEKVRSHINPQFVDKFKRASLFYWGRSWESCWIEHEGTVISVDEMGAPFQPIPRRAFRDETI